MSELPLNDEWMRLKGVVRKMAAMSEAHYALKHWRPWKAAPLSQFGEDWPVGTVITTGNSDGEDWCVCTDNVRASETNGATAKEDAEAIAAMHNAWLELVDALNAVTAVKGVA